MNDCAERAARGELCVEGDHDQLLDSQRGDQLGLSLRRRQKPGGVLRSHDGDGVRVEAQHGVRARDHGAVSEVHADERPDSDAARVLLLAGRRAGE